MPRGITAVPAFTGALLVEEEAQPGAVVGQGDQQAHVVPRDLARWAHSRRSHHYKVHITALPGVALLFRH